MLAVFVITLSDIIGLSFFALALLFVGICTLWDWLERKVIRPLRNWRARRNRRNHQ